MKSRPRLIAVSLLAIWSGALVIGKVQIAGGCGKLLRIDAGATGGALPNGTRTIEGLLVVLR
jgi:hypothetical protein